MPTGVEYPVPWATVHVEDTDCSLFGYLPHGWPWSWFLPLLCRREEIATAVTGACGRFCVWIPPLGDRLDPPGAINPYQHWSTDPDLDNAEAHAAVFALAGASPPGAYSFSLYAASRAFNPEQASGFVADWNYDPAPNYVVPSLPVAVVNA